MFFVIPLAVALALTAGAHAPPAARSDPGREIGHTAVVLITPTPAPAPLSRGDPPACGERAGTLVQDEISIPGQIRSLPFLVYLPPCYAYEHRARFPTLYLLHGLLGTDRQWEQAGAFERADALIGSGEIPPFILVTPWERTGLEIEPSLVDGLIPYVDSTYRTRTESRWRAIGGLSRGGGQALAIGLKHPDLFGHISMHSPAVLHADGLILRWWNEIPQGQEPSLWIDIGLRDSLFPSTAHLIELLYENGVAPTHQFNTGDHELGYWQSHVETYLRWHAGLWQREMLRAYAASRFPR